MTPDDNLVHDLLRTHSGEKVAAALRAMGYDVSRSKLEQQRHRMLAIGVANRIPRNQSNNAPAVPPEVITRKAAEFASKSLADKINAIYQRRAEKLGCSPIEAQARLNYSPVQLAKMGLAA